MVGAGPNLREGHLYLHVPCLRLVPRSVRLLLLACLPLAATLAASPAFATMPRPDGTVSPAVQAAAAQGLFALPDHSGLETSVASKNWWVPVVIVNFADSTWVHGVPEFQHAILDTTHSTATGSVADYWEWVSRGRIKFRAEVVGTVTLPHPENYYAFNANGLATLYTPQNDYGLVQDCVRALDPTVDWNRYDRDADGYVDMIWIVHPGLGGEATTSRTNLWSLTGWLSYGWSNAGPVETLDAVPGTTQHKVFVDRFTILPEMSYFRPGQLSEIGVFCHEFGHALGLPDLYDTATLGGRGSSNVGPGNWSLMSTGTYGGDSHSPEYPTHPGGWCSQFLGLTSVVQPTQDTLVVLTPQSRGGPVYSVAFQGESGTEHFLLESRYREGFDRNLPASGLLVTQVDEAQVGLRLFSNRVISTDFPAFRVLEADGRFDLVHGQNQGDASDLLPGAFDVQRLDDDTAPALRLFSGAVSGLAIEDPLRAGSATMALLHVRAAGWQSSADVTAPGWVPVGGTSRGHRAAISPQGTEFQAFADYAGGIAQVKVRSRSFAGSWSAAIPATSSPAGAYDPVLTRLPNDDLGLAWTDVRAGFPQVYYRARLGGAWTPETALSPEGVSGIAPAITSDRAGRVYVTWLDLASARPAIRFLDFPAGSPSGTIRTVSDTLDMPLPPAIAATPDGHGCVAWSDRGNGGYEACIATWAPDTGLAGRQKLSVFAGVVQPSIDVASDSTGTLHLAWQQVTGGISEIHYSRRPPTGQPSPADTVLVSLNESVQNPAIATDLQLGVHLIWEHTTSTGQEVRYKRWRPGQGWDGGATTISSTAQGSASDAAILPITHGNVTVLYSDFDGTRRRQRTRIRRLDGLMAADAPPPASAARGPAFHVGPSPVHAGAEILAAGPGLVGAAELELFDASGRRVASARPSGGVARFTPAQTRDLVPGLYFARPRGGEAARVVVLR